jgi:uncharacterized repeat protein (TIGR03837 family)
MRSIHTCDIFCNVIDNFGDIGVAWRLARQLAAEHGLQVRLWVDDLASMQRICPEADPAQPVQSCRNVEVRHWNKPFPDATPADLVIEAFACNLPDHYLSAMASRERKPVWINLEYLSAEDWVLGCHCLPSPHPHLPLIKHFFFPGFVAGTGGLLFERDLFSRRSTFQKDVAGQAAFWQGRNLPQRKPDEIRISLFSYENDAVPGLFDVWAQDPFPVCCLVPEGRVLPQIASHFGKTAVPGGVFQQGNLEVRILPFSDQDGYDQLLWACDLNFVRGEDSFVRAQWAVKPMIWHIYPQQDAAHWRKLSAFLGLYCAGLPQKVALDVRAMWEAWNQGESAGKAWRSYWQHRETLGVHARRWSEKLMQQGDLASNLVHFCSEKL